MAMRPPLTLFVKNHEDGIVVSRYVSALTQKMRTYFEAYATKLGTDSHYSMSLTMLGLPEIMLAHKAEGETSVTYTDAWRERFGVDGPNAAPPVPSPSP